MSNGSTLQVRGLHRLIKAAHHLHNVSANEPPPTINNMTETLSTMIKPAALSVKTMDLISGNAKNWSYNTLLILRKNHIEVIDKELQAMLHFPNPVWKETFNIASAWARRNLGRRLLTETLEKAEALLVASFADRGRRISLTDGEIVGPTPPPPPSTE